MSITVKGDPSKSVTYGQLIGGKRFNVTLTGDNINATTGAAAVKPVQELKNVGLSPQRYDIPRKSGRVAQMGGRRETAGHGSRAERETAGRGRETGRASTSPPFADMPGFVKVVSKGNYVAVVCEREEQAINAANAAQGELGEAGHRAVSVVGKFVSITCAR